MRLPRKKKKSLKKVYGSDMIKPIILNHELDGSFTIMPKSYFVKYKNSLKLFYTEKLI